VSEPTSLYRTIEKRLDGKNLRDLVADRRRYAYSWAAIARELSDLTDAEVSREWVRRWFGTDESERGAA
jgi:hypothetical protein